MSGPGAAWGWAALAALWLPLWARLAPSWAGDPELAHGWAVPALAIYLARERARPGGGGEGGGGATRWRRAWGATAAVAAVMAGAMVVLLEASPYWTAAGWVGTGAAGLATLALAAAWAGARRAADFFWPVAFLFTALPWPSAVQAPLTLGLASVNAEVAAELVSGAGYPAVVAGRVIEVGTGLVGVDEACSGMRSLQTVTMVALFFGELFRMGAGRRAGLLAVALATALAGNLARTCALTWWAATEGIEAMEARHDAAGAAALFATLAAVAGWGWLFSRGGGGEAGRRAANGECRRTNDRGASGAWWRWAAVVCGVMVVAEVGTRLWYARGETTAARVRWELVEPEGSRPLDVPEGARVLLGFTSGGGVEVEERESGRRWLAFVLNWSADAAFAGPVFRHDPTLCLPSVGAVLEAELEDVVVTAGGVELRLRAARFRTGERVQRVFFCVWDGYAGRAVPSGVMNLDDVVAARWAQVRDGRRRTDWYHLTFAVEGAASDAEAVEALRGVVPRVLRRVR